MIKLLIDGSDYDHLQWTLAGFDDTYMWPGSESEVAEIAVGKKTVYVCV